jgi:hypothetical protein
MRETVYQELIREDLARQGLIGVADARHIEAWMRCEHPTLDGLSTEEFSREVALAAACVREASGDLSEQLAKSFGLDRKLKGDQR